MDTMDFDLPLPDLQQDSLADTILESFVLSKFGPRDQDFLPNTRLDELVTNESIRKELELDSSPLSAQKQQLLTDWILREAKKVFAITVQCSLGCPNTLVAMTRFYNRFNDDRLPIEDPRPATSPLPVEFLHPGAPKGKGIWSMQKLYDFYEKQWKCLSPVFEPSQYNYDLRAECIFPFIWKDKSPPKEGAFSSVHQVEIHDAHQLHAFTKVAIKEIELNRGVEGTQKAWEVEARALEAINELDHPHIIKCIAAIRKGDSRYFMFPWADGDSLRDFWETAPHHGPQKDIVEQAIAQLRGVADALDSLHNFDGGSGHGGRSAQLLMVPDVKVEDEEVDEYADAASHESIRHGDLKPENILRFMDNGAGLGTLKIADLGLAKRHVVKTQERNKNTSTRFGTVRYEPPEAVTSIEPRSRLYDIWSMGCITLEFIIWILYGDGELNNFYDQVRGGNQSVCQYFEISESDQPRTAQVHSVVLRWMNHIQNTDPECSRESAIRDLLKLVRTKLLVVPLPPNRLTSMRGRPGLAMPGPGETRTFYRATAAAFRAELDGILAKAANQPGYLVTGEARDNVKVPAPKSSFLAPSAAAQRGKATTPEVRAPVGESAAAGPVRGGAVKADYTLPPLKDWEFPVDNTIADKVLAQFGPHALRPLSSTSAKLCDRCLGLNFWAGGFALEDRVTDLKDRASTCHLCKMLYAICLKPGATKGPKARFERTESNLMMTGAADPLPVLSILRSPELKTPLPIQMGFPEIPQAGGDIFFGIIQLWLEDCNENHPDCRGTGLTSLPTRLIDVGTRDRPALRLIESGNEKIEDGRYIALSHPWGDPLKHPPFRTLRKDYNGYGHDIDSFRAAIPYDQLPATFKDAVDTTRTLGVRYLWIDSICIIQGPDGDFNSESKRMEDVFSCAYCVLAASRATGVRDGFLGKRPQREYLTFQRGTEKPFYVCEPIDNFSHHVLEGSLNRRGWVLQERALARRTVFFAENQTYFECGRGVRCETMARTHNNMSDFLGDPGFPEKAMRSSRGLQIRYFQDLYREYSRLEFSRIEDRPIAIRGLEHRLRAAYKTDGYYGVFDDGPGRGLFHRSLLWRRGDDESGMSRIAFPQERNFGVPTWSWMAYRGGIDYLEPPFETTDWEDADIRPPWSGGRRASSYYVSSDRTQPGNGIPVKVRDFNVARWRGDEVQIVYDTERTSSEGQRRPQCVVVAKAQEGRTDRERRYYVLIVAPTQFQPGGGDIPTYERLGAGYMLGKYIVLDNPGTPASIF